MLLSKLLEIMHKKHKKLIDRIRTIIRTRPTDYRQTDKTLGPVMTSLCSKIDGNCPLLPIIYRPLRTKHSTLTLTPTFDLKVR